MKYPAKIIYDKKDKYYNVSFIDLDGCFTYGETLDEAKQNAKEALTGFLESLDSRKIDIPEPSVRSKTKNIYYIEPDTRVAFAINLKLLRKRQKLTQQKMAKLLDIKYQTYQKFENPKKCNPNLKTILKIEEVLHEKILNI